MIRNKIKGKISRKLLRKKKKLINYKLTEKAIIQIFEKNLIIFAKYNKFFYELFFNNGLINNNIFIENLYKFFIKYYFYKTKGVKSRKLDLSNFLTSGEIYRLNKRRKKEIYLRKKNKVLFKFKNKKERKIKTYFYIKEQNMLPQKVQKTRLSRFFKSKMDGRFIPNQKPFNFKNNVIYNLINYDNFGIIVKKPKKIILTRKKFQVSTTLICNHFLQNLLVSIYKNYKNFNFSLFTQKYYTRIFDFCMFKDLKIYNTSKFFIKSENMDTEDNDNAEDDVDALKFYSGLTIKFTIRRRNCFFQIWDDVSGFTLAKVSAGIFGYYFKKGIKRFKQFNVFIKFFRYYFNSIVVTYRQKIFKRFLALRHIASKEFKIEKLKIFKKRKFIKNNNNIFNIINYYKNFLNFNSMNIKLEKFFINIKRQNIKKYYIISSKIELLVELKNNIIKKLEYNLNLFLDITFLNKILVNIKISNKFKNIKDKLIDLIKLKNNKMLFNLFFKIIFFCASIFKTQNSNNLSLKERRVQNKKKQIYYKKKKYNEKWNKLKRIMSRRARYNGLNFIFFHRSKLNFTYILTMRKPFFQKRKIFSLHWTDIYTKIKRITNVNDLSTNNSLYKILSLHYKIKAKTNKLISFYNLLKFSKQCFFKSNIKPYYKKFTKRASYFKLLYSNKYFNLVLNKSRKYLIYFNFLNNSKYLVNINKFKNFNILNLFIFYKHLKLINKVKIKNSVKKYNILSLIKVLKILNKRIKEFSKKKKNNENNKNKNK